MGKKTFLKGAAILGVAGLITQVLGAVFRIPLGNIIGADGMAYYSAAYAIYIFLLVFSTNGAPAAISKLTSERIALGQYKGAYRVFRLSFVFMAVFGLAVFSIVFFGADAIGVYMGNEGAVPALKAIAPALIFVPVMSVYRGYFQGMQEMGPTALSQVFEQAVRVASGLTLAVVLLPKGLEIAAAGAAAGGSIGPVFGIVVLIIVYIKNRKRFLREIDEDKSDKTESASYIIRTLALIAVPITIGVSIQPIMNLCDTAIVMNRLKGAAGFSAAEAEGLFGALTGFAIPVINVPMALALSMALSMVPAIAAAKSTGDDEFLKSNISLGFRTSIMIGVPCSLGLMSLASPIMRLLFPMQTGEIDVTSSCLFIMSAGIVFLCIAQTMAGALQGIGKSSYAVWGIVAGIVVKCLLTYILSGIRAYNVRGAAFATLMGYMAVAAVNFAAVRRSTGVRYDMRLSLLKPLAAGMIMTIAVVIIYKVGSPLLGNSITTIISIICGAAVYGITLIKTGAVTEDEIKSMPKGGAIVKILRKTGLI